MSITFGLALSGGGARGIAHIGVLQALNEMGYNPAAISGTSAGALVGAFYAAGLSPANILAIFEESKLFGWQDIAWNSESVFKGSLVQDLLLKHMPVNTFEALSIPLTVCATDFSSCHTVAFHSGDLIKPLMASAAIPAVFHAVDINGKAYYDGGLTNNLPADMLVDTVPVIVGVHVNALQTELAKQSFKTIIERSFHIMISSSVKKQAAHCALMIEPPLIADYSMFDMDKGRQIYESGYRYTLSMANDIKKALG